MHVARGIRLAYAALLLLLLALGGIDRCLAHPANIPSATARVTAAGAYEVQVRFDVLAFLLEETPILVHDDPMNALLDGPTADLQTQLDAGEKRFRTSLQISSDTGAATIDSVAFPTVDEIVRWRDSGLKPRLPVMGTAIVRGHLAPGAKTVSFGFSDLLGTVILTTELPYREPVSEPLDPGAASTPLTLPMPDEIAQAKATMLALRPTQTVSPSPNPSPSPCVAPIKRSSAQPVPRWKPESSPVVTPTPTPRRSPTATPRVHGAPALRGLPAVAAASPIPPAVTATPEPVAAAPQLPTYVALWRFVKLGYTHILPEGTDHILFVLGLFLLSTRLKPLLTQITAFTIAHSLTLALALYGVVRLPSAIVEPIIAASIVFVAVENLFVTEMRAWRPAIVFGFGLIHGLGFAGALQSIGLQRYNLLIGLIGFNSGVELGQLTVVAAALLTIGWFRARPWYRARVVIPGSLIIAGVALFWVVQRLSL